MSIVGLSGFWLRSSLMINEKLSFPRVTLPAARSRAVVKSIPVIFPVTVPSLAINGNV